MVRGVFAWLVLGLLLLSVPMGCGSGGEDSEPAISASGGDESGEASAELTPFARETAQGERYGYQDPDGEVVIQPRFQLAEDFSEAGLAAVVDESGWAYINRKGDVVVRPFVFDNAPDAFSQGLARFEEEGRFGFFDESGTIVIPPRFQFARSFSEGLAAACKGCQREGDGEHWFASGGKWGYVDRQGEEAIPFVFDAADSFQDGRAQVTQDGATRWIGKDGQPIE